MTSTIVEFREMTDAEQSKNGVEISNASGRSQRHAGKASSLLRRLFRNFNGSLALRLWDGTTLRLGGDGASEEASPFTLVCHNPSVVRSIVLGRDPLCLAESYFRGDIDIEGDFFAALGLKDLLHSIRLSLGDRLGAFFTALRLLRRSDAPFGAVGRAAATRGTVVKSHSKRENRESIQFHYDVSNEFYALWLDHAMVYSCAYFEQPADDLETAQKAKLDHICKKLQLEPGERLLDIGCGWGALVIHAARHYGVRAHGVTLSIKQLEMARDRIASAQLRDRVTVELRDYRDLAGEACMTRWPALACSSMSA